MHSGSLTLEDDGAVLEFRESVRIPSIIGVIPSSLAHGNSTQSCAEGSRVGVQDDLSASSSSNCSKSEACNSSLPLGELRPPERQKLSTHCVNVGVVARFLLAAAGPCSTRFTWSWTAFCRCLRFARCPQGVFCSGITTYEAMVSFSTWCTCLLLGSNLPSTT